MTTAQISSVALNLFSYQFPNGQYLIPYSNFGVNPTPDFPENATIPGTAIFTADLAVVNLDWNKSTKDTVSAKYYYQHDPTSAPYAYSNVAGFTQHLDAGSQVASLSNTQSLRPNLSVVEVLGILREKVYSTIDQPFTPQQLNINTFGSSYFPGISIVNILTGFSPVPNDFLQIGQGAASQGAFTGVFQNRIMPSANAIWITWQAYSDFRRQLLLYPAQYP